MRRRNMGFGRGMRSAVAVALSLQLSLGSVAPAFAIDAGMGMNQLVQLAAEVSPGQGGEVSPGQGTEVSPGQGTEVTPGEGTGTSKLVLDSAWEVEKQNENLVVNDDGSITIKTEKGTIGGDAMNNVLYQKLPNQTDYVFTVKVNGEFTQNYQGAYLMIASGKNLENAVGVVRRYHGFLGGDYGTNMLMGVMQDGNPSEYYTGAADIGDDFYLRLQKNNGRVSGYYAKEYSDDVSKWTKIIDTGKNVEEVDKGSALVSPSEIYIALGAASGGENNATDITFSDLRIGGVPVALTTDPEGFYSLDITGESKMEEVTGTTTLSVKGFNAEKTKEFTAFDSIEYSVDDETIATVDQKGVVTGKSVGKVNVTVKVTIGGVTRTAVKTIEVGAIAVAQEWKVASPDGKTSMTAQLMNDGTLQYTASRNDAVTIPESPAGIVTSIADFSKGLVFKSVKTDEINETYNMLTGKSDTYTNHCNETTITFTSKSNPNAELDFIIRAYDDGTAYRYGVRNTADADGELKISKEVSGVQLPEGTDVYWMNYNSATWNYEGQYQKTTADQMQTGSTPSVPILFKTGDAWTLFTEADLHGSYCGSMLTVEEGGLLRLTFAKAQESRGDVVTTTPFTSPWRTAITGTPEDIVETTLIENLNPAADEETYKFSEWVDPGMSSWSWVANWGSGVSDQTKAETHMNWIDLAADMGWEYYILDEGWQPRATNGVNAYEGYRDWFYEVRDYAREKGVKLCAWVRVNDIRDAEDRQERFEQWSKDGIVAIKADFFDSEGQETIQLYDDLYKDAAKYKIMVNCHGANKPTGEIRTYPNVFAREAIRGQEAGGITAEQYTIIPFIRGAIGPADVTEELRSKDYNKTTMGFQVALTALFEDGIHSMGSAPDVYMSNPIALEYYTNYPDRWNETELVSGEVGEYVNIARRAKNEWYLSGISVDPVTMNVPLTFLDADKEYCALIYQEAGRYDLQTSVQTVNAESTLEIPVLYGGGYAVRFVASEEIASSAITEITAPEAITVEEGRSVAAEITVAPETAQFKSVKWTSADPTIATVENGTIKGIGQGETVITVASAMNENIKKEIKVTVTPPKYVMNTRQWSVLGGNGNYTIDGINAVTITAEPGVLGDNPSTYDNLFAMDVPEGAEDFTISAKISGGLKANYQGGFVAIFDKEDPDKLNVTAGRRYHTGMMSGHPEALAMMSSGGSVGEFYCEDGADEKDVYVRLEKKGDTFTVAYSYDGKEWNPITDKGTETVVTNADLAQSENLAIGFYAGVGGGNTEIDITISEFAYNGEEAPVAVLSDEWKDNVTPGEGGEVTPGEGEQKLGEEPTLEEQLAEVKNQLLLIQQARDKAEKEKAAAIASLAAAESAKKAAEAKLATAQAELQKVQQSAAVSAGDAVIVGKLVYKVTNAANATVSVCGTVNSNSKKITIPATIKIKGKTFKVTGIGSNAFANNTCLTKVVIGANVTTIGKKAFYKASKLKTVQIKSTTLSSFGKNAFKGIKKNAVVRVAKSKNATYKTMLKKSGISSSVKVK